VTQLKLPYVKTYRDRHGRTRHYFRRRGSAEVSLPGAVGSQEFMAAYQGAMGAKKPSPHAAGTFARLVEDYYRSAEFVNLKPSSQRLYRLCLDPIAKRDGHRLVRDMPRDKIRKIIEEIAVTRKGMANVTAKVLRLLLSYAVDNNWRADNPAIRLKQYRGGTRHTWTDAECAAFEARWPTGSRERLAYALLLYLGQRVGDTVRMRRQDISGGFIRVVQEKTGVELEIEMRPELLTALRSYPAKGIYLIGDMHGRPFRAGALTNLIRRAAGAAGLSAECKAHGLRKSLMRQLAEGGATTKEVAAVSGHKSLAEVERYTRAADQKKLSAAAMAKLKSK
jgi:enterobacteria phage integrase